MDVGNRVAIVLAALAIMFFALLVAMLAWGAPEGSVARLQDFVTFLADHQTEDLAKLVTSLGAAVVVLLGLLVVILELSPPPTPGVRITAVRSGDATITSDVIAERVQQEVLAVEHVTGVKAQVAGRRTRVEIDLDLDVDPEASLAAAADEACSRTRDLLERRMSIPLARPPRARLHYRELRLGRAGTSSDEQQPVAAQETVRAVWERPGPTERQEAGVDDAGEDSERPS